MKLAHFSIYGKLMTCFVEIFIF